MAVNTQKLLPSAKGSPLAKISVAKISKGISIRAKKIDTQKLLGPTKEDSGENIKETLFNIDSLLKSILGEEKKNKSKKRKEKEKSDYEKEEKKLEAPKEEKKFKLPGLTVPGMGLLDRIKRFLFFTALGWLFTKFQSDLPKLLGIVKTVSQVYVATEGIFKSLLGGLINFIDIGYQTYDGLRKKVEDIGGKDAVKTFDEFSGHLNKLINGAIIASTLIMSTASRRATAPSGAGVTAGISRATPKPISGFGGGTEMTPGRYRAPGQAAARGFGLEQARKGLTFEQSVAARKAVPVAKGARFGGGRIPIVGPLITFVVRTVAYGEKPQKAAAAAVGMGIGQAIGGFIGTLGAGALGLGTAGLGAIVAPLIVGAGSVIGGLVGEWLGATLYDFIAGMGNKNKPQLKASGGPVTRGGKRQGAVSRSIKITRRRPPKVKPKQSQPGKDVGGKKNIQKLYPDPSAKTELEGKQQSPWFDNLPTDPTQRNKKLKSLPNPYKALTGVAKKLKDIPFGIGALMGGAVDIALGEKLPQNAIDNLGNGIAYLINSIANQQVSASISDIGKEISKMQTGGIVPRLRDFSRQDDIGTDINKVLNGLIRNKVDEAIKEVQKQMMLGVYSKDGQPSPDQQQMPPGPGTYKPFTPGQFNVIEYITGDPNTPTGRFDRSGHGTVENYHDHIAFRTEADKERAKKALRDAGIVIGSEYRPGDPGYHGSNLAIDVPGYQWGGTGEIGQKEYEGSARVRRILGLGVSDLQSKKQKPPGQQPSDSKSGSSTASWYGPDFYGNKTADGTVLERDSLWVAHKTLPLGTKVKFTYKGKTITLPVKDRGPFIEGREWDLTEAAAEAIGLKTGPRSGTGSLQYEVLGKKGGGYVPKQAPNKNLSSLRSYPSYSQGGMMIAIQPIEKQVPMPMPIPIRNSSSVMFAGDMSVNNNNLSLMRG